MQKSTFNKLVIKKCPSGHNKVESSQKGRKTSKFQYIIKGLKIMTRTGDAGDGSSLQNTTSEFPVERPPQQSTSSGPKYPELENVYELHKTIGNGGFSKVKMATEISTGNKVAIKIVDKEHVGAELPRIALEIETLQPLSHRHICKLYNVIYSERRIFMIMEYCPTDLYEYIVRQDEYLSEDEARRIFIQLMSAVAYLHMHGIAHRDLKPENVLIDYDNNVKLTDFGLCAVPKKSGINKPILRTMCGSPAYCAPELLKGPPYIGSKADVWSLGVLLFVLLAGQLPFYSKNLRDLYKKIQEVQYSMPERLSAGAKDIIDRILQSNVTMRPSLNRLWSHPWIQEGQLEEFKEQINLAENEMTEELIHEFGDVKPSKVVGYMESRSRINVLSPDLYQWETLGESNGNSNSLKKKLVGWITKGFRSLRKNISKALRCFANKKHHKEDEENNDEPLEVDLASLFNADVTGKTGLTVFSEFEFADCLLDKLQTALQTLGIQSERTGSSLKHGVTSPCKFKFEVVSIKPWNLLCIRRSNFSAKDPKLVHNIIQRVLLLHQDFHLI